MMTEIDSSSSLQAENTIQEISGVALSDNRVRAMIVINENHSKPNLLLTLRDASGKEVSRSLIMGTITSRIGFTLHIRTSDPTLPLSLTCITYLDESHPFDEKSVTIPSNAS
jgi:hypothetical protein